MYFGSKIRLIQSVIFFQQIHTTLIINQVFSSFDLASWFVSPQYLAKALLAHPC